MQHKPKFPQKEIAIFVVWQSLVVKAYRSFFAHLCSHPGIRVACASPKNFCELGSQKLECEPVTAPFSTDLQNAKNPFFQLSSWNLHTQIVYFFGMTKALKTFFCNSQEKKFLVCIAEPYSLTAFFTWCQACLSLKRDFVFILYTAQNIYKALPWPLQLIQNFLFKRCHAILSLGPEQSDVLRKQGYGGLIYDFPLWFDSALFQQSNKDRDSKVHLGFAGSLIKDKGIFDFLQAFDLMPDNLKKTCTIHIAGRGPAQEEVQKNCKQLQDKGWDIHFLGPLSSAGMLDFYQKLDILVVPSRTMPHWKEQFGRVIVEARACGVMVLGSDSGAIPHVIGNAKRIFKEGDVHDLAKVLNLAIAHLNENRDIDANLLLQSSYADAPSAVARGDEHKVIHAGLSNSIIRSRESQEVFNLYSDEVLASKLATILQKHK